MSNLNLEDSCEMSIKREHSPITDIVARPFHNSANHMDETLNSVKTELEPEEGSHHPEIKQEPDVKREPELKQEEQSEEAEVASATAETVSTVIKSSNLHLGHLFASCQVMGVFRTVELANVAARSFASISSLIEQPFTSPNLMLSSATTEVYAFN